MNPSRTHKIALLFNANNPHDRDIIAGVSSYLRSTRVAWEFFVEDDFLCRPDGIVHWNGDGILANYDDPHVREVLASVSLPAVGVGGTYCDYSKYPPIPHVASDNARLVEVAYEHLVDSGLQRFAFLGRPPSPDGRWAQEREAAFRQLMARDDLTAHVHHGSVADAHSWLDSVGELAVWLASLPKPIGIIAANDAGARLLLQACNATDIAVPEDVAIIGIDDCPLNRMLSRVPLSSVIQGTHEMGRLAAQMLHRLLCGMPLTRRRVIVGPQGINEQASSRHQAINHPAVRRGCHFIRQYAFQGIKAEQVADYVGLARSSLDFHFRCHLGRSIHDEILRVRLEQAKKMLADPKRKLAEVARSCGFKTAQYLNAVFQRECACTPLQYRKHVMRSIAAAALPAPQRVDALPMLERQRGAGSHPFAASM